jgi:hypothetical protein
VFSVIVVVFALVITWLVTGESSPLHEYFLWHVELPNLWALTVFFPFVFSALISGNPHSPPMAITIIALIVQWAVIGFLLSIPLSRMFVKP